MLRVLSVPFWGRFGLRFGVRVGVVLVPFWHRFRVDFRSFWRYFRPWGVPGVPLGSFEWLDGVLGGPLGVPWASLGVLWGSMGHPWGSMGHPWGVLVRTVGVP